MNLLRSALTLVVCLAFGSITRAQEEKVPLDKVPAKVKDGVKAKFPGAEMVAASKEKEGDKTVYEISIKNKGQNIDVTLTEDGKIVSIESEIAAKDLPKPVAEALEKKYPKATVEKIEEISKGDKITYELVIKFGEKKLEVVFDPQGKFVTEEDQSKEKDEKKDK
jgi:uncharacterized membrane protein YkoI